MNANLELTFFIFALVAILIGIVWIWKTEQRLKRFFAGKKGRDLEIVIMELEKNISDLEKAKEEIKEELVVVNQKLKKSIRGIETIRFNPFPDQGSNQSFAIGIVNEEKDGEVISSLYSRERMSIFAKPVKGGESTYELSLE